ncbi:hypothetical protein BE22_0077 [Staphylococcus phage vB_SepS_BE22]|nr:hypothetical protein BE22_0077 [Staphylococcus phage vB_SepS_BE22]
MLYIKNKKLYINYCIKILLNIYYIVLKFYIIYLLLYKKIIL